MKVTTLYVYPIKSLRGVSLDSAELGPQGIRHDRSFMLYEVCDGGVTKKIQLSSHPHAALFEQEIQGDAVVVRYHAPPPRDGDKPSPPEALKLQKTVLEVPLEPEFSNLEPTDINLHGSPTHAYRMGEPYDAWFSACFGHPTRLIYLGDGQRPVLGTMSPTAVKPPPEAQSSQGWLSSFTSYIPGFGQREAERDPQWITFTDCAPLLVTSESSCNEVSTRLSGGLKVDMYKFRPNIVVDGEGEEPYAEDFWGELTLSRNARKNGTASDGHTEDKTTKLLLTSNCLRCTSLNVDYQTGRPAVGELGTVLKKLMKDRRVDKGVKWSPVFGRYAFVSGADTFTQIAVGDEIEVSKRNEERTVLDWPGF